jgi:choline/glycine/proline betaine transport protein
MIAVVPATALESLLALRATVSTVSTWFVQGSKAVIFVFMMYIWYKYGHIKFGDKDDMPEYSRLSYFSMTFAAGMSSSALFYSVQEPLFHQLSNFFVQAGYRSQDEVDMFAINMTVNNWGIICWVHYTLVSVCMSLALHRFNLPLTFRSCFYPILGPYTWGWIGDFIDGLGIIVAILSSCSYLGSSAILLVVGFIHLGLVDEQSTEQEISSFQNVTIWIIIMVSTAIVITGLRRGIFIMSNLAMGIGTLLLILVFFMEDTKYLLNLQVQEVGLLLQTGLFQLNLWTDAFGQLEAGSGRAIDGKAAEQWWMT